MRFLYIEALYFVRDMSMSIFFRGCYVWRKLYFV